VSSIAEGVPAGLWNAETNPEARLLSIGGICEDAISGVLSGISSYGHHIGVGASYGAFLAPLSHIAARLHAIGAQAREAVSGDPYDPMILVCGHAGLKTGEDGPTHADPQPLQLLQENFPAGTAISLTPWEPQEIWPLVATALARRPALISAFVTRPNETVLDRMGMGLAPAEAAAAGVYVLRRPEGEPDVTVVLQESAVTYAFVEGALPRLVERGVDALVYYVASAELFTLLPEDERRRVFPEERAAESIGVTGFTLPTLYRWVCSDEGRAASLHPYRHGRYLGSGQGHVVLAEAGLDGESQARAILDYVERRARSAGR
jgi:transketolase